MRDIVKDRIGVTPTTRGHDANPNSNVAPLYRSSVSVLPEEVLAVVGEIDAKIVDKIVATGASLEEIGLALSAAEIAVAFDDARTVVWSPRIAAVRALLEPKLIGKDNIERGRD
jgi:hypothetical protein